MNYKTMNFSIKEILPALINKTKITTIRPAWNLYNIDEILSPKYLIDDRIRIYWKEKKIIKRMGDGIISNVNLIRITNFNFGIFKIEKEDDHKFIEVFDVEELAKNDGFKSKAEMFEFLNRTYRIKKSKYFYLYEWRWINEENNL